jgi:hypothetical protein
VVRGVVGTRGTRKARERARGKRHMERKRLSSSRYHTDSVLCRSSRSESRHHPSMLILLDVISGGPSRLNLAVTLASNSCCLPHRRRAHTWESRGATDP